MEQPENPLLVGMHNGVATLKTSFTASHDVKCTLITRPRTSSYSLLSTQESEDTCPHYRDECLQIEIIQHKPNGEWINKLWIICTTDLLIKKRRMGAGDVATGR